MFAEMFPYCGIYVTAFSLESSLIDVCTKKEGGEGGQAGAKPKSETLLIQPLSLIC